MILYWQLIVFETRQDQVNTAMFTQTESSRKEIIMKRVSLLIMASGVLVLFGFSSAYASSLPPVPEPGTIAVLGALAAGGFIARKIIKRK